MENGTSFESTAPYIVGIGASAGGLEAIESFFKKMPINSGLAFVVVQHLSPDYKSLMAELLSKHTEMPVHRIEDGMAVNQNHIYLIPPRQNLTIFHGKLLLKEQVRSEGLNLPVDIFLRSLAEDAGNRGIAIILSGTGSDGTRGIRAIKEHGGMVMVQDEESAKFTGMPNNATATGLADFILAPDEMPPQLLSFIKHPYSGSLETDIIPQGGTSITRIFALLREKCKIDFTYYKPSTVMRRIERRVSINQLADLTDYVRFMETNQQEINTLYQELLIGVTCFFRDEFVFQEFNEKWLPESIGQLQGEDLRLWVTACSTGEEAYSLAMLLAEYREQSDHYFRIKIFATDIDQSAIEKASAGLYPESIAADVPPELLSKYFSRKEDNFQVTQKIREMVVFAQHNLIKDPPFTNIHMISCRNVLIYLQPVLQKKILELFNFSLTKDGLLLLGTSETIGDMVDYFDFVSPKSKLYRSKGKYKAAGLTPLEPRPISVSGFQPSFTTTVNRPAINRFSEDRTLERFVNGIAGDILPFTMLVNENMEISHTFGEARDYLSYPSGKISSDVTKIVIKDLAIPIATGINKALKGTNEIVLSNIRIHDHDQLRTVTLTIKKLPGKKSQEKLLAVMISETTEPNQPNSTEPLSYDADMDARQRINDLEQELQFTRENLQTTVEELETSNEELQATNEELLASNEELQSTNEELQSVNEELYTVNAEYQGKITELTLLNNDLDNLFNSTNIATLFLDENLEVRRFTHRLESIFHIRENDLGRPFFHLSHSVLDFNLDAIVNEVSENQTPFEQELQTANGDWYLLRVLPYAISDNVYAGIILTFIDIDRLKRTETELKIREKMERERLANFALYSDDAITLQDLDGNIVTWNRGAEKLYGWTEREALGMKFQSLMPSADISIAAKLQQKNHLGEAVSQFETRRLTKSGKLIDVSVTASLLYYESQGNELIALTERDISAHMTAVKNDCVSCLQRLATLVMDTEEALILLDPNGKITAWNKGAENLYGWQKQESIGRNIADLTPESGRTQVLRFIAELTQGCSAPQTLSTQRLTKNNQELAVKINASVLGDHVGEALLIAFSEQRH